MSAIVQDDMGWGAIGAVIGAVVAGLFAWLVQRSKGGTDIEVAVIAEWKSLNAALSARLSAVEKELADLRLKYANEIDEMRRAHRAEMSAMRNLNEGLQRQIAQNSQSTAHLLSGSPVTKKDGGNGK